IAAQAHTGELDCGQLPAPVRELLHGYTAPLRRETFTAGRLAAARATAALTGMPRWLSADGRGAPSWPYGVAGSLSHTNRVALCVTGPDDGVGLGIDIEPLETGEELLSAVHYVCTPEERERLCGAADPALAVLRLFCVKEALYKALPPDHQDGTSFQSVALEWQEPPPGTDPAAPVHFRVHRGPFPGTEARCALIGSRMVAAVSLPRPPGPVRGLAAPGSRAADSAPGSPDSRSATGCSRPGPAAAGSRAVDSASGSPDVGSGSGCSRPGATAAGSGFPDVGSGSGCSCPGAAARGSGAVDSAPVSPDLGSGSGCSRPGATAAGSGFPDLGSEAGRSCPGAAAPGPVSPGAAAPGPAAPGSRAVDAASDSPGPRFGVVGPDRGPGGDDGSRGAPAHPLAPRNSQDGQ
ncbi:4'-phosphopantetheinyl transferase superfamily protein, partial [Streptomyces sp. G1]|uniref:4'-phosphopantetheinyl transferase superfamily protein n=1 Tax=Streptomyces sp. G1 TaxID=361572 RepID=UPI00202EF7F1